MLRNQRQGGTDHSKTKILIVDDHPIVQQGLSQLIGNEDDLTVCGLAEDATEAMMIIRELKPDLVIVDISLGQTNGIELIKTIKVRYPGLLVLALSMHDESLYAERCLRAGARGYIMKIEAIENVITAIRKVMRGQIYVSNEMAAKMVRKLVGAGAELGAPAVERLSDRELEVFRLIGLGHGTRRIAERLHLSVKTIETYRAHIKKKLNLADADELLRYAIQWSRQSNIV